MAEVGKPGRTTTGLVPTTARQIGLPGLSATPWTRMPGAPRRATTRCATSPAPFEVPPDSTTRSAALEALAQPALQRGLVVGDDAERHRHAAQLLDRGGHHGARWNRRRAPGRSAAPGGTSSSPVESTATRGRRQTSTAPRPTAASMPISRAVRTLPRRSTVSPRAMSLPAKAIELPGDRRPQRPGCVPVASSSSVCSTISTASAPRGSMPPVAITVAVPGATGRPGSMPGVRTSGLSCRANAARHRWRRRCPEPAPRSRRRSSGRSPARRPLRRRPRRAPGRGRLPSATLSLPRGASVRWRWKRATASSRSTTSRNCSCRAARRTAAAAAPLRLRPVADRSASASAMGGVPPRGPNSQTATTRARRRSPRWSPARA